jgi:hypothetical protein
MVIARLHGNARLREKAKKGEVEEKHRFQRHTLIFRTGLDFVFNLGFRFPCFLLRSRARRRIRLVEVHILI